MKSLFSRGTCTALLACVLLTARAEAEPSLELFAGRPPYAGAPANTVPVSPNALALAPNGTLYLADGASGKILSFDPATSTITSVPNLPGALEARFSSARALGYGPGVLNLADSFEHWQLDLTEGFRSYFGVYGGGITSATFGPDGSLYFSRYSDHAVFKRTTSGTVTTVAGSTSPGFSGDGTTSALFNEPRGVVFDAAGNIYIADSGNHRVRRRAAATGIITTVAGTGATNYNGANLLATQTNLFYPTSLAIDAAGNLYIHEAGGSRIRRLNAATGRITNFAGNGSPGGNPGNGGLAINASIDDVGDMEIASNGTLYIAEVDSYRVRKVDASGIISHVIGNGTPAFCGDGAPAREACLYSPQGVTIDDAGNVYVSDRGNGRIRKISATTGLITTIAGADGDQPDGDGGPALAAHFLNGTTGIAMDAARNLYILNSTRVRRVDAASGIITTIAGSTSFGFSGDGGPAVAARFRDLTHLALDPSGNIYVSDTYNHRVRRIDAATGIVTTVAGNGLTTGPLGDGGPATAVSLLQPNALAFDPAGNLLIGDTYHYSIRKVNLATGVITTIAGNGSYGFGGNGGPATAAGIGLRPVFAVDTGGNIYLTSSYELRRIDAQTGIIARVPPLAWGMYTPEGRGIEFPTDMVLGADNRLYIADANGSNVVFRVSGLPTPASDLTPPVIEPTITGTLGNDGWYTSDVQVSWTTTDDSTPVSATEGCGTSSVTTDTAGVTFTCTASSAGGSTTRSITVKRDATPPHLAFSAPSPAPNANGWNNTNVSIPFTHSDAMSGLASTSAANPLVLSAEGTALTVQVSVTDIAGNTAEFTTAAVNIDKTAPTVNIVSPLQGTTYGAFTTPSAQYNCSDAISTVACVAPIANGAALPTHIPGAKTFAATATDAAGNTATLSRSYSVAAMVFERFMEPMRRSPTYNGITAGNLIPIRWRLLDGAGGVVSNLAAFQSLTALTFGCQPAVPLFSPATGGPGLSHNPATGVFTYNWQTDASWTGCRRVQLRFSNNSMSELIFRFQ